MNIKKYLFLPLSITVSLTSFQTVAEQKMLFEGTVDSSLLSFDDGSLGYGSLHQYQGQQFTLTLPTNWQNVGTPYIKNSSTRHYRQYEFAAASSPLEAKFFDSSGDVLTYISNSHSFIYQDNKIDNDGFKVNGQSIIGQYDFAEIGFKQKVQTISENIDRYFEVYLLLKGGVDWFDKSTSFENGALPFDSNKILGVVAAITDHDKVNQDDTYVSEVFIDVKTMKYIDSSVSEVPLPAAVYLFGSALLLLTGRKKN